MQSLTLFVGNRWRCGECGGALGRYDTLAVSKTAPLSRGNVPKQPTGI